MEKKEEKRQLKKAQQPQMSLSDRFTNKIISAYQEVAKGVSITPKEKALIANYFIGIDKSLKESKKSYTWGIVDMNDLAISVARLARLGLDMGIDNMVSFIPFRKGDTGQIKLTPIIGYKGYEYRAMTYGLKPPKNAVVELIYDTDTFKVVKKDITHKSDSYIFEINNPFDRGEIIGGFGYLEFEDEGLNQLLILSKKQILSYRPAYFDKTFWSGENEKKMFEKTIAKQLFKKVTLDPEKVNATIKEDWDKIEENSIEYVAETAKETIQTEANQGELIDIGEEWVEQILEEETSEPVENIVENVENAADNLPAQDALV